MRYYKAFDKNLKCRGFKYKIGETYTLRGKLKICSNGFHFYNILNYCYRYYPDNDSTIICLVEPLGDIIYSEHENKLVTNKIKIVRQLTKEEIEHDRFIIQEDIKFIGRWTFDCCSLESITIPNSVTYIDDFAFRGCRGLKNITIPNNVTFIGDYAFNSCRSLKSIIIPNSVTSIGESAFCGCTSLTSVTIPESVTFIGDSAFYSCESLKSITIPDSVTEIGFDAFSNCTSLESVTIPNSVTSIGRNVFDGCTSLKDVTIPDSVTSIGDYTFDDCNLITIYCNKDSYAEQYAIKHNIRFEKITSRGI